MTPVTFINYIPLYYASVSNTPVPPLIIGKFVQIKSDDTLFLVFSPRDFTKYHANIIERFCYDKGLEGSYDRERKRFDIHDKAWTIAGGGKFAIDKNRKAVKLFDDSMVYGKFEKTGLREIVNALPEFTGYTIIIE
jgi:hypothetical protein